MNRARDCSFQSKTSTDYFRKELIQEGMGARYLVSQSFYKGNIKPEDIPEDDMDICMQMTILVQCLATRQLILLGRFLELLFKKIDNIKVKNAERNVVQLTREKKVREELKTSMGRCPNCHCHKCSGWNTMEPT